MPFTNDGPLKLLVTKIGSSYDFVVIRGTTNITYRGSIQGRLIWSSPQATNAEIRNSSGRDMGVSEANLQSVFILSPRPRINADGKLTIQESTLRNLKTTDLADYNRIMESFLPRGEVRLDVATTSTQTHLLVVGLQQDALVQNIGTAGEIGTSPTV